MAAECQRCLEYAALVADLERELSAQPGGPGLLAWLARDRLPVEAEEAYYLGIHMQPVLVETSHAEGGFAGIRRFGGLSSHQCEAKAWHRAGGLRLASGEGPVRVRLRVACEREP